MLIVYIFVIFSPNLDYNKLKRFGHTMEDSNTPQIVNNIVADSTEMQHERRKRSIEIKILSVLCFILTILIGSYLVFWQYSVKGSFYSVKIIGNKIDKSADLQAINKSITDKASSYRFTLTFPNQEAKQYKLEDAGITIDANQTIQNALSSKTTGNIFQKLRFWRKVNVPLVAKTDDAKMTEFIKKEATKIVDQPQNARLAFSGNTITISPEQAGSAYFDPALQDKLNQMASKLEPLSVSFVKQIKQADITTKYLESLKPKIAKTLDQTVTLTISGKNFVADAATIKKWIDLPDFSTAEKFEYEINSGNIQQYIDTIVKPYVRGGKTQVEMTRDDGTVSVLVRGVEGSDVIEKQSIAKEIADALKNGQGYQKTLSVSKAPMKIIDAKTYDKWILVNVTNKFMQTYEKDRLVRTFLISAGAPATPTVLGQYTIRAKVRIQDMRGRNVDGSSYYQPNVEFVNYFYGGQAIHGNYWRPLSWFGNVNSSHGCVGLPNPEAEWVYNWAPIGTPIVIHN